MLARSVLKATIASAIILSFVLGSSLVSLAQNTRPRYSSHQGRDREWSIPEDTIITVRMNGTLSSRTSHVGDKFSATVDVPVYVNGKAVIPAGSIVEGRVTQVTPAKRMGRSGAIAIDFDNLVFPAGARVPLNGVLTSDDPETRRHIDDESRVSGRDAKRTGIFVGGSGAIGAVLGGIAGGGKGAAVGGVLGAGAGVAAVLFSKGEEAQVPSGTPFGVQLRQPLVVREDNSTDPNAGNYTPSDRNTDPVADPQPPVMRRGETSRNHPIGARPDDPAPDSTEPEPDPRGGAETRNPDPRSVDPRTADPRTADPRTADPRTVDPRDAEPRGVDPADADPEPSVPSGPPLPLTSPEMIGRAQAALKEQGYYEGEMDGAMNPRTISSLKTYQRENNLPESGELNEETARKLGILGGAGGRSNAPGNPQPAGTGHSGRRADSNDPDSRTVLANVLSATASRTADGAIFVAINTQANTGGWRWYGEQVVNGDTLEVYARAVRPTGMVTQALTRGKIELNVRDGVEYVRRVVIHSSGADQVIALGSRGSSGPSAPASAGANVNAGANLQRQAEDLLSEYQRIYGVQKNGSSVQINNSTQDNDSEVELFFALDSFANAARLYSGLVPSLQSQKSLRSATLSLARQARRTDIVVVALSGRIANSLELKWDAIRQDVLRLMQGYGIQSSELEN